MKKYTPPSVKWIVINGKKTLTPSWYIYERYLERRKVCINKSDNNCISKKARCLRTCEGNCKGVKCCFYVCRIVEANEQFTRFREMENNKILNFERVSDVSLES